MADGYTQEAPALRMASQDPRDTAPGLLMPQDADVSNAELQVLDALEETVRTEDPDALERYVDGLPLSTARQLHVRARSAAREHIRRSEQLERLAGAIAQQVHAAGDGLALKDTRPTPAR